MKAIYLFPLLAIPVVFSFCNGTAAKNNGKPPTTGFAVVELFTSEGCSSCPPADEAMIRLAGEFPDHVYFLGFHVDYWDYIGWKDVFDNPEFTKRQDRYAAILKLESIYTPQVIINGEKELVGSRESQIRTIIRDDLQNASAKDLQMTATKSNGNTVTVSCMIKDNANDVLNLALVQTNASTEVKRGENNGRRLNHMNIVRQFKTIAPGKTGTTSADLNLPADVNLKDLKLIAFTQNAKNMKITGACEALIQ